MGVMLLDVLLHRQLAEDNGGSSFFPLSEMAQGEAPICTHLQAHTPARALYKVGWPRPVPLTAGLLHYVQRVR